MLWGGQFQNAYMDATKGGPDGIMWAVSAGGHHLWASSTTQSFTMANPAITYEQGKKNALKALNNSGMMAGTPATGVGPGSTTGPGGGGGCWPYNSNQYVDGQGWSDCTEEPEPAAYAQIVSDPQIHQGQYTLFNYRVWWANSFDTNTNSDFYVTQAYMVSHRPSNSNCIRTPRDRATHGYSALDTTGLMLPITWGQHLLTQWVMRQTGR